MGGVVETLDEIWADDRLGRREDAQLLFDFLVRRHEERRADGTKGAYVVNLNAGWGHGKTFFMERFQRQLKASGYLTASVNAWRDDSSKEPVVAVMAAIEASLKPHFAKADTARKAWDIAKANSATVLASLVKGASRRLAEKYAGQAIHEIADMFDQKDFLPEQMEELLTDKVQDQAASALSGKVTTLLTKYVDQKIVDYESRIKSSSQFQSRMRNVLSELESSGSVKAPFFVLIDELDRCRPTYAIEMLEQVKHLFDIDNTIFIIATDGDQLSHSVKAVYGEGFDGKRYLLRFFQRHYRFEHRDLSEFVNYLFSVYKIDMIKIGTPFNAEAVDVFVGAMKEYDVTLRDAEQCFDILRSILTVWEYKCPVQLSIILPLIIFYQRHDLKSMSHYMDSNGSPPNEKSTEWYIQSWEENEYRRRSIISVPASSLNSSLLAQAKISLNNIYSYEPSSTETRYVMQVLQNEFQVVHGNSHTSGKETRSVLNKYPSIVRRIGRLSASDETS